MSLQNQPLQYSPSSGAKLRTPLTAAEFREMNPKLKWYYNPWTGKNRHQGDIEFDAQGVAITY